MYKCSQGRCLELAEMKSHHACGCQHLVQHVKHSEVYMLYFNYAIDYKILGEMTAGSNQSSMSVSGYCIRLETVSRHELLHTDGDCLK